VSFLFLQINLHTERFTRKLCRETERLDCRTRRPFPGANIPKVLDLYFPEQEKTMKKVRRSFAAALLLLALSAVALADGQMDIPLTGPTPQAATSSQTQTDATLTTSSTTDGDPDSSGTTLTEVGLILFESISSVF
jgi:hypothetical protein